jgi:molybdopterin converting factor small subunit
MHITIRLFGIYRELSNQRSMTLEIPEGTTTGEVWRQLSEQTPRLNTVAPIAAVNMKYAGLDQKLCDGDEVAFLPPVGGG